MTNELTGIVACTLLTIAQLAIVASGLALMLRFTAIARRFFLVGLGLVAATGFVVPIISDVTADEAESIRRYKLEKTLLYTWAELTDPGSGLLGVASRIAFRAINISVTVEDLVTGKRIECADIVEMLAAEEQIKEAAATFKQVLEAALQFGGEETVVI